jgi:SpoIID/LytB domain protein
MSQYGARGAALRRVAPAAILAGYYPGTAAAAIDPAAPMRVRLLAAYPTQVQVAGAPGLVLRDASTGRSIRLADVRPRFRIVAARTTMSLQYSRDGGAHWGTLSWGPDLGLAVPGPLTFSATAPLRLLQPDGSWRDYDGSLTALRLTPTALGTVNTLPHDRYVAGVVGREMPASWPAAALAAQAVAARTYSAHDRAHAPPGRGWDTCDSTACQVYGGRRLIRGTAVTDLQPAPVLAAVAGTAGQIRTYAGAPIFAQFSASNGGWSVAGAVPYLAAVADPDDAAGNPWATWARPASAAALARCAGLRTLTALTVLARDGHGDWGGRLVTVRLTGTAGTGAPATVDLPATALRQCLPAAFPSTYATIG